MFTHNLCANDAPTSEKTYEFAILDWQRTRWPHPLSIAERCRDLAALHASVADDLANAQMRLAFLAAYCGETRSPLPRLDELQRRISEFAAVRLRRSSVREQRLPTWHHSQPLFWLDGEAIAATPRCCELWSKQEIQRLAYGHATKADTKESLTLLAPDLRRIRLTKRRTVRPLGQAVDWCRNRRWTAPELRSAAHLLRQERLGAPPRLLAFGQKFLPGGVVDSFMLENVEAA